MRKVENKVSGMIECRGGDQYVITVNAKDNERRQRFTLAHEIGHFIYHRSRIGDGLDDDRLYRSTDVGKYHNTDIGPRQEAEANEFAATVLMPWGLIAEMQDQGVRDYKETARRLNVSEQAMKIRLGIA
jgi:Zn-dependent peptidase ImmA (M78 family)